MREAIISNVQLIKPIADLVAEVNKITPNGDIHAGSVADLAVALHSIKDKLKISDATSSFESDVIRKSCDIASYSHISRCFIDSSGKIKSTPECRLLFIVLMGYVIDHNSSINSNSVSVVPRVKTTGKTNYSTRFDPDSGHIVELIPYNGKFVSAYGNSCAEMDNNASITYHHPFIDVSGQGLHKFEAAEKIRENHIRNGRRAAELYYVDR